MLTEAEVRERVAVLCPPELYPELGPADLDVMVRAARRADLLGFPPDSYQPWQGGVAYSVGALCVPVERNGSAYRVSAISGTGVAGTVEPAWPAAGNVVDGQATWAWFDSAPWTPTWAVNAGAARGWEIKAGKAAARYSFSAGTDRFDVNQIAANCLQMARMYRSQGAGVAKVRTDTGTLDVLAYRDVIGN